VRAQASAGPAPAPRRRLPPRASLREAAGFALAGAAAYVADLAVFVWLRDGAGLGPLTAKALSFLAGCAVAYAGNALGTYRERAAPGRRARRYGVFFAVNVAGALVQLACLGASHYLLGLTTPRDDVVAWAGVGMVLATCLRFWGTRTLVFGAGGRGDSGVRAAGEGSKRTWTG
jgi:putative flippase GtrA